MANLVILNKIKATAHIVDCVAPASTKNGYLVKLGEQNADKTYAVSAPGAANADSLVIVLNVNLPYDVGVLENDVTIATGDIVRAYVPEIGNVISIPVENIEDSYDLEVGEYVVATVNMKMAAASSYSTESVVFVVEEELSKDGIAMAKLRCIVAK